MTSDLVAPAQATRGRTVIDDRVRTQLIERAALSVPGVVARRTMVPGRSLPVVTLDGAETVDIQIAAAWPVDARAVMDSVRAAVLTELGTALAERPERVDVTIARVESERTPAQVADVYDADPAGEPVAPRPRRFAPRRAAVATYIAVLIGAAMTAAGAVAIREALTTADPWIAPALQWTADAQWQWWVWPVAALAAVLGLVLLVAAVTPRRRTHVSVGDHIWVPRNKAQDWAVDTEAPDIRGETR